jgi:Na+/glutamate symporter
MLTLIKIFFFFVLFVFLGGIVARYLMKRFFRKMQDNMNQQNTRQEQQKKEGKVTIEYEKDKKGRKRYKGDQGEYVDYEEVDE